MKTIQIKIETLEKIIQEAKNEQRRDSSLSSTIEFRLVQGTDTHLGNDRFSAVLKSGYAECDGRNIYIPEKLTSISKGL